MQMAHHGVNLVTYRILGVGNKLESSLSLIKLRHALPFLVVLGFLKPLLRYPLCFRFLLTLGKGLTTKKEFCDFGNNYTPVTNRVHRPFLVYDDCVVDEKN